MNRACEKLKPFLPKLDLELWGAKLDETWTQGSSQYKEQVLKRGFSQIPRFPFQFWMNSRNLQIKGAKAIELLQDWAHMLSLILATFPMEKIEEKLLKLWNRKSGQKYLWKSRKRKTWQHNVGDDSMEKHKYIDANQESTRYGNHPNILPLFRRLGRSLTSLWHEAHPHLSKNEDLS
jgi:hypothetical protein